MEVADCHKKEVAGSSHEVIDVKGQTRTRYEPERESRANNESSSENCSKQFLEKVSCYHYLKNLVLENLSFQINIRIFSNCGFFRDIVGNCHRK